MPIANALKANSLFDRTAYEANHFHVIHYMTRSYRLLSPEFTSVSSLAGPGRYAHFIKRIADWEVVWGLRDSDGWVLAGDDNGNAGFPVWPHPEYAAACATGEWSGNQPTAIDLNEFVELWLPKIDTRDVKLVVFPTGGVKGVMVHALQLKGDIEQELEKHI